MAEHRRIRTGTVEALRIHKNAIRDGVRGVAVFPTGMFKIELREYGAPRMTVNGRTGEVTWQGGRLEPPC